MMCNIEYKQVRTYNICHHHKYENKITLRKNLKQPKKLKATKEQKISSRATREQIKNNHKTNSKMKTS